MKSNKQCWLDSNGRKFSAGGILIGDAEGLYLVGEVEKGVVSYGDIGGRYMFEDCNIWATIRRELYEETYGIVDVLVKDIKGMVGNNLITIDSHGSTLKSFNYTIPPAPGCGYSYMCMVVHSDRVPAIYEALNEKTFTHNREITISESSVPEHLYTPIHIRKIRYADLKSVNLSHRMRALLPALVEEDFFRGR